MAVRRLTVSLNLGHARAVAQFCARVLISSITTLTVQEQAALRALARVTAGAVYGNPLGEALRAAADDADAEDTRRLKQAHEALIAAYASRTGGEGPIGANIDIVRLLAGIPDLDATPRGADFRWWGAVLADAGDRLDAAAAAIGGEEIPK